MQKFSALFDLNHSFSVRWFMPIFCLLTSTRLVNFVRTICANAPAICLGCLTLSATREFTFCSHFGVGHCLWPLCNCQGTVCIVFEYSAILKDKKILIDILDLKELTDCRWCVKNIKLILILLNIIEEGRLFNATFVCASVVKWI